MLKMVTNHLFENLTHITRIVNLHPILNKLSVNLFANGLGTLDFCSKTQFWNKLEQYLNKHITK